MTIMAAIVTAAGLENTDSALSVEMKPRARKSAAPMLATAEGCEPFRQEAAEHGRQQEKADNRLICLEIVVQRDCHRL
ncbi:MAG: hypothetical protein H6891_06585 [Brucellaceae bacterium]|nr:hypothetical protein [Brucellaceae bacterium]